MEVKVKKRRYVLRYARAKPVPNFLQLPDSTNYFQKAVDIIEEQLKYRNRGPGLDEVRARPRPCHGRGVRRIDHTTDRRMRNTMGYQSRVGSACAVIPCQSISFAEGNGGEWRYMPAMGREEVNCLPDTHL